jgi:hypothetical protein
MLVSLVDTQKDNMFQVNMQHDPPLRFTWSDQNLCYAQAQKLWKKDQVYSKRTCETLTLESTSETQKPSHHIDFNPNRWQSAQPLPDLRPSHLWATKVTTKISLRKFQFKLLSKCH